MKNTDIDGLLRRADFAAGSEHKKTLHGEIFPEAEPLKGDKELTDDELDLAAAGVEPSRRTPDGDKKTIRRY